MVIIERQTEVMFMNKKLKSVLTEDLAVLLKEMFLSFQAMVGTPTAQIELRSKK